MKSTYSNLTQSRYFNPAFNSAIFDGPVRIYFSQIHESLALKIYFSLQQQALDELTTAKELHKSNARNLLIMLYPNHQAFQMSFDETLCERNLTTPATQPDQHIFLAQDSLDEDSIIGINGPFEDHQLNELVIAVKANLRSWSHETRPQTEAIFA